MAAFYGCPAPARAQFIPSAVHHTRRKIYREAATEEVFGQPSAIT